MARARPHTNTWLEFLLRAIANHTLLLFASDLACKRDKASWCWSWFARLLVCFKCFLILFIKVWILAKRHQGEILSDRSALTGTRVCMCTHTRTLSPLTVTLQFVDRLHSVSQINSVTLPWKLSAQTHTYWQGPVTYQATRKKLSSFFFFFFKFLQWS